MELSSPGTAPVLLPHSDSTPAPAVPGAQHGAPGSARGRRYVALVPCAGSGSRAGTAVPKQYSLLNGLPVVEHTLRALSRVPDLEGILVVLAPEDTGFAHGVDLRGLSCPVWVQKVGGATRAHSVQNGLEALRQLGWAATDWVLVHDAARCLVQPARVQALMEACRSDEVGGLLALPVADTIKQARGVHSMASVDRADKWLAQTPKMFGLGLLGQALSAGLSRAGGTELITDEASAIEALGYQPRLVRGDLSNIKITWPEDFEIGSKWLRAEASGGRAYGVTGQEGSEMEMRMGEGWDIHALVEGRPLVLGGVHIPHAKGLGGHSDADALLHAITDAVLGGAGLGDIGRHFPDTDERFKGADSWGLLQEAARRAREHGWRVGNVDATIVAQAPKMAPHIPAMVVRIALALDVPISAVNVKAKTAERFDAVGHEQAIEARAVCLLRRSA